MLLIGSFEGWGLRAGARVVTLACSLASLPTFAAKQPPSPPPPTLNCAPSLTELLSPAPSSKYVPPVSSDELRLAEYLKRFYEVDLASMNRKRVVQNASLSLTKDERTALIAEMDDSQLRLQRAMATMSDKSLKRVKWTPEHLKELQSLVDRTSHYLSSLSVPHEIYTSQEHPMLQILHILPGENHQLNKLTKGLSNKLNTELFIDFFRTATVAANGSVIHLDSGPLMTLMPRELNRIDRGAIPHEIRHVFVSSSKLPSRLNILKTWFSGDFHRVVGKKDGYDEGFRLDELYAYQTNIRHYYSDLSSNKYLMYSSVLGTSMNLALNAQAATNRVLEQFSRLKGEPGSWNGWAFLVHRIFTDASHEFKQVDKLMLSSKMKEGQPVVHLEVKRGEPWRPRTVNVTLEIPISALDLPPNTLLTEESAPLFLKATKAAVERMHKYAADTSVHIGLIKAQLAEYVKLRKRWEREGKPKALAVPLKLMLENLNKLTVPTSWPQP